MTAATKPRRKKPRSTGTPIAAMSAAIASTGTMPPPLSQQARDDGEQEEEQLAAATERQTVGRQGTTTTYSAAPPSPAAPAPKATVAMRTHDQVLRETNQVFERLHVVEEGDEVSFRLSDDSNVNRPIALGELQRLIVLEAKCTSDWSGEDLLMNRLMTSIFTDPDPYQVNAKRQLAVMAALIAPDPFIQPVEQNEFLTLFYFTCMPAFKHRLCSYIRGGRPTVDSVETDCLLEAVVVMLTRLIDLHRVYMKRFVVDNDLLSDVLVFLRSRYAGLQIASLAFFQKLLLQECSKNDYIPYIRSGRTLRMVEQCWEANNGVKNALYSALLEFYGHVIQEPGLKEMLSPTDNGTTKATAGKKRTSTNAGTYNEGDEAADFRKRGKIAATAVPRKEGGELVEANVTE